MQALTLTSTLLLPDCVTSSLLKSAWQHHGRTSRAESRSIADPTQVSSRIDATNLWNEISAEGSQYESFSAYRRESHWVGKSRVFAQGSNLGVPWSSQRVPNGEDEAT